MVENYGVFLLTTQKIALIHSIANHPDYYQMCLQKNTYFQIQSLAIIKSSKTSRQLKTITNPSRSDPQEPKLYLSWQVFSMPIIPVLLFNVRNMNCGICFIPHIIYRLQRGNVQVTIHIWLSQPVSIQLSVVQYTQPISLEA